MCPLAHLFILPVEDKTNNMVHLSHTDNECTNEVEASLFASSTSEFVLCCSIRARDFGDGTEEEMCAVGEPIDLFSELVSSKLWFANGGVLKRKPEPYPFQFSHARYALQGIVPRLQNDIVWHVLWEVELGSFDLRESTLDHTPHDVSYRFGAIQSTVEVPTAEIELFSNGVNLFVREGIGAVAVAFAVTL